MTFGLPEAAINRIRSVLAGHPEVERAVLYGSRAKGSFKPGSDIDLTLLGAELSLSIQLAIESELDDLLLPYEIDLSLFDRIEDPAVRDHIERVGKAFYEAGKPSPTEG